MDHGGNLGLAAVEGDNRCELESQRGRGDVAQLVRHRDRLAPVRKSFASLAENEECPGAGCQRDRLEVRVIDRVKTIHGSEHQRERCRGIAGHHGSDPSQAVDAGLSTRVADVPV